jgi:hypothetical protein
MVKGVVPAPHNHRNITSVALCLPHVCNGGNIL